MELYQLKLFVDLAEIGNFTKVASQNYITQAAVTLQIRKLEKELGVQLFYRTTRTCVLVEAGDRLLPYARHILQKTAEANQAVRDTTTETTGLVRAAAVHSAGLYELPPYVKAFLKEYPRVNLRLDYRTSEEIYRSLQDGEIDLGVVAYPHEASRIECLPFLRDHLVVVCPQEHPFARKKAVNLAELAGQNFVQFGLDTPTRRATDAVLEAHGIEVDVRMECDNIEILKQMVEIGFGIALLPHQALTPGSHAAGLRAVTLRDVVIERPLGVLLLKNTPRFRAVSAFLQILCGPGQNGHARTTAAKITTAAKKRNTQSDATSGSI
ncbi:MAG TPA: LysR family transcriptional regulator [Abditibacteriaceae bacterium]|nr:LysR family transcriptional regulator [Abditibacteriaceae bacterium]